VRGGGGSRSSGRAFWARIDLPVYDRLLAAVPLRAPSDRVAVVQVDERSLAEAGRWPWPRDRMARSVDRLREMGAAAVGLDVLLPEPDVSGENRAGNRLDTALKTRRGTGGGARAQPLHPRRRSDGRARRRVRRARQRPGLQGRPPHEDVVDAIAAARGTQFDPDMVDAFMRVREAWRRIAIEFADEHDEAREPERPAPGAG
jgi:hypothetical protein